MKRSLRIDNAFIFLLLSLTVLASCREKSDDIKDFIISAETVLPVAESVDVDNFAHQIVLKYQSSVDLSNVQIRLNLAEGVEMDEPGEAVAYYDLTSEAVARVKYKGTSIKYSFVIDYVNPAFDPTSKGWVKCTNFGTLPAYLSVYKGPAVYESKNIVAYIAVADMNNQNARFSVLGEKTGYNTPSALFEASSKPAVIMNAGYFWSGSALGLVVRNSVTVRDGNPMVYRTLNEESTVYYPTQAAFGYETNGTFSANWAYTSSGVTYSYPSPAPNKTGTAPMAIPTSLYPAGAARWSPVMAIGAGPMLVNDGAYSNTWEAEMFDASSGVGPTANNPRSAIGVTEYGYLIFFVCEGRNMTPNTPGLSLENVAGILLDLGCVEAINLDGGGSSCMLINGQETIKPSDGTQRKIVTAVAVY